MGYGLGVDLGTTFTAAAVSGDFGTRVVPLGRDVVAPSTVFIGADGTVLTGDAAEAAAAADPLRVSRGHKRRLGDPTPLVIGGVAYSPAALLAAQLRAVVATATGLHGAPPDAVVLTCPAIWGPYRREHFDEVP
ncbi:Hsp70 family protein, partial [Saccharothrix sp. MB29]|nr:Hsp70 family protein [Saccharothrix sp. MB29]